MGMLHVMVVSTSQKGAKMLTAKQYNKIVNVPLNHEDITALRYALTTHKLNNIDSPLYYKQLDELFNKLTALQELNWGKYR